MATVNQLKNMSANQLMNQNYQLLAKAYGPAFIGKSKEKIVEALLERRKPVVLTTDDYEFLESVGEVEMPKTKRKATKRAEPTIQIVA